MVPKFEQQSVMTAGVPRRTSGLEVFEEEPARRWRRQNAHVAASGLGTRVMAAWPSSNMPASGGRWTKYQPPFGLGVSPAPLSWPSSASQRAAPARSRFAEDVALSRSGLRWRVPLGTRVVRLPWPGPPWRQRISLISHWCTLCSSGGASLRTFWWIASPVSWWTSFLASQWLYGCLRQREEDSDQADAFPSAFTTMSRNNMWSPSSYGDAGGRQHVPRKLQDPTSSRLPGLFPYVF
jgi:hypothetical protein